MQWLDCYGKTWKGLVVSQTFKHPAKFAPGLIERIYAHATAQGWFRSGDVILDPFGGVALGALYALQRGFYWMGVEIEAEFVTAGRMNIALWEKRYANHFPGWGWATLLHGDSRFLLDVLHSTGCAGAVTSPPYADGCAHTGGDDPQSAHMRGGTFYGIGLTGAVSSPPYADSNQDYADGWQWIDQDKLAHNRYSQNRNARYGNAGGQLGRMRSTSTGFNAAVSSPPWQTTLSRDVVDAAARRRWAREHGINNAEHVTPVDMERSGCRDQIYGVSDGQLGTTNGTDFWQSARLIVEQTYRLLRPGAVSIWVTKDFIRNGERVPFSDQWQQLCEAVGFAPLERHRAMLVKDNGTQLGLFGQHNDLRREHKSFFRRLAERKGSPRIDWEDVLCLQKRAEY